MRFVRVTIVVAMALGVSMAIAVHAAAARPADFTGRWLYDPKASHATGMMADLEIHLTVEQSDRAVAVHEESEYAGQKADRIVRYDLGGKEMDNRTAMGDPSKTVSHWDDGRGRPRPGRPCCRRAATPRSPSSRSPRRRPC